MDPILGGALIGGGAGLLKSILGDGPAEARQKAVAGATQRYSPWTGMQAQPIKYADPFGSLLQGGTSGALMGGMMKAAGVLGKPDLTKDVMGGAIQPGVAGTGTGINPSTWAYIQKMYSPTGVTT